MNTARGFFFAQHESERGWAGSRFTIYWWTQRVRPPGSSFEHAAAFRIGRLWQRNSTARERVSGTVHRSRLSRPRSYAREVHRSPGQTAPATRVVRATRGLAQGEPKECPSSSYALNDPPSLASFFLIIMTVRDQRSFVRRFKGRCGRDSLEGRLLIGQK